ncbi:MAG: aminotransferase class V-fold PLP-dependent enzyme, partial [Acidimicrobiia bacterium]|nr:aminotransferase class V-fold PLP-dependent enzyme [Acidimicrobiia bacterium]
MRDFGRSLLDLWHLDPSFAYLNHGTVGATPKRVLEAQRSWVERIERHPAEFMLRRLSNPMAGEWTADEPPAMRQAAGAAARYVGADPTGMALVDNITTGANAVLRSLELGPGDVVAVTNLGYDGVTNAVRFVTNRAGATVNIIDLPAPGASPDEFAAAFDDGLQPGTKLAVIDHLSAFSALILPVERFIESCRAKGAMVLVDGAHVPGQLDLDVGGLAALGADFYTANLHKWGWTPRSSGFLWVAPEHRSWVHPAVISWGLGRGLEAEFDLVGTRDPTPFLVIPQVIDYRASFGEERIRSYMHETCWAGARYLAAEFGTSFDTPESMIGAMAVVGLPLRLGSTPDDAERLRAHL